VQIGSVLPTRKLTAIRSRVVRLTHPGNYKGEWTDREKEQLLVLHEELGNAWSKIGAQLERLPGACRDKIRELTSVNGCNSGRWSLEEENRLMESCQKQLVRTHECFCFLKKEEVLFCIHSW
jgi:hypothetical protein